MARLTKYQEAENLCAKLRAYSFSLEFEYYTVQATVIAENLPKAESYIEEEYPNYKTKKMCFQSNRINFAD